MQRIFFTIDDWHDPRKVFEFTRLVDQARAMGRMSGQVMVTSGMFSDMPEVSFIMLRKDFDDLQIKEKFCKEQAYFLVTNEDTKQPAQLLFNNMSVSCGGTVRVTKYKPEGDYTWLPDTGEYLVVTWGGA